MNYEDEPGDVNYGRNAAAQQRRAFQQEDTRRHPIGAAKMPPLEELTGNLRRFQEELAPRLGDAVNRLNAVADMLFGEDPRVGIAAGAMGVSGGPVPCEYSGAMGGAFMACDMSFHLLDDIINQLHRAVDRVARIA